MRLPAAATSESTRRRWSAADVSAFRGHRAGPIGLELSHEKLHMVQMQFGRADPCIQATTSLDYSMDRDALMHDPAALKRLIKRGLAAKPFVGNRIVTVMPAGAVKLMLVPYRATDDVSEAHAVLRRALERLGGEANDWVVDYLPVQARRESDSDRAALVACAQRSDVLEYLDHLHRAGLEVDAVEVGPVSLCRLIASISESSTGENVLTINFGRTRTYITVYAAGTITLDRELNFGEKELAETVACSLDMTSDEAIGLLYRYGVGTASASCDSGFPAEIASTVTEIVKRRFVALAAEVEKAMMYTASQLRGAGIDAVYLLGSVARWPGAETLLSELLSIPVHVLNPFSSFVANTDAAIASNLDPIAGIALATGCALRGRPDLG